MGRLAATPMTPERPESRLPGMRARLRWIRRRQSGASTWGLAEMKTLLDRRSGLTLETLFYRHERGFDNSDS